LIVKGVTNSTFEEKITFKSKILPNKYLDIAYVHRKVQ